MAIDVTCECGKTISVGDEFAGKYAKCPDCGKPVHIVSPEQKETSVTDSQPAGAAGTQPSADDLAAVERLTQANKTLRAELSKAIVGQEQVVEELMMCIFARGHAILEGVPGLAKTLMVSSLARCLNLDFARIQFTPDLMPSDITGTEVIQEDKATGGRELKFLAGPIFNNIILADEINRTPPKTQAALLESMQERQVSVSGQRMPMPDPFFVLATQNPIEQEGTYPLPEAQQDRFMFKILVNYPSWDEEFDIIRLTTAIDESDLKTVMTGEEIVDIQHIIRRVPVADHVIRYAMRLVRATRIHEGDVPQFIYDYLSWGAGPRACQYLILGGKVRAVLHGRFHVSTEDIQAVAKPVLRHRIVTNFNADAEGFTPDKVIERLIETIPAREGAIASNPDTASVLKK
jgi:MoxR-like ATPase